MPRGADIDQLLADLRTAPARVMGAAARAAKGAVQASVDSGYQERVDVQGKPYLLPKDGHLPPMERSGALRRGYRYSVAAGALYWLIRVIERTPYGKYLRDGTPKMAPRQHIPRPGESIPARWDARIRPAIEGAVRAAEAKRQ